METGLFWRICRFEVRNGQIRSEFLLLCCRPRKGRFSMETGRFWPICPFEARKGQIWSEFLLLCCRPRKGRFLMETGRFWRICHTIEDLRAAVFPQEASARKLLLVFREREFRRHSKRFRNSPGEAGKRLGNGQERSEMVWKTLEKAEKWSGRGWENAWKQSGRGSKWSGRSCKTLRNGLRGAGRRRALGGLGKALGGPWSILNVFLGYQRYSRPQNAGGCSSRVPGMCQHLRGRAPSGRHGGGSRPALPGLHDDLCRWGSSGSFGLRVAGGRALS